MLKLSPLVEFSRVSLDEIMLSYCPEGADAPRGLVLLRVPTTLAFCAQLSGLIVPVFFFSYVVDVRLDADKPEIDPEIRSLYDAAVTAGGTIKEARLEFRYEASIGSPSLMSGDCIGL
eukprot:comp22413_c1_seq1/m.33531 comp22413_c1_seq1/g.33531  ORF comp22413_c1_seq1/g.33531 comp22413_c1_seq1/m.33531 type:complete len:118 (+) comp22413_c1_seq1:1925-2278(+)